MPTQQFTAICIVLGVEVYGADYRLKIALKHIRVSTHGDSLVAAAVDDSGTTDVFAEIAIESHTLVALG